MSAFLAGLDSLFEPLPVTQQPDGLVPPELADLPDDHYEPFRSPRFDRELGAIVPGGAPLGWRLTSKGRAAALAAKGE